MSTGLAIGIALLLSIYIVVSPKLAPYIYRPMLFHPLKMSGETMPPTLQGVKGQEVIFGQEAALKLCGWLFRQHKTRFVVLISHGNGGNINIRPSLIEGFLQAGASVFIFDYCGYGKSEGLPDPENVIEATVSAYRYLIEKEQFKPSEIISYGESLGGAPAAYLSAHFATKGLIVQSGFTSLHTIAVEKFPLLRLYPAFLFPTDTLDTCACLKQVQVPVLIVHGSLDPVVPVHHANQMLAAANEPKSILIFKEAHHNDITQLYKSEFVRAMSGFVTSLSAAAK